MDGAVFHVDSVYSFRRRNRVSMEGAVCLYSPEFMGGSMGTVCFALVLHRRSLLASDPGTEAAASI